jgi:hypothetical protein
MFAGGDEKHAGKASLSIEIVVEHESKPVSDSMEATP